MSNRHPWAAFYWEDWRIKTAHLSLEERGAYISLLQHYYQTGEPLVADAGDLLRVCGVRDETEAQAVHSVLAKFFTLRSGSYHNDRADEELAKRESISKERAKAGLKGGKQKSTNRLASAEQEPTHPQPQPEPHESQRREFLRPQFKQSDFDERDYRKLAEAKKAVLNRFKASLDSGNRIDEDVFMTAVCEQSGLLPHRVKELEKKSDWRRASA